MDEKPITPEEIDEAILEMRFPRPSISSDEAARKAVSLFNERPEAYHCAPAAIIALQEAYDLPGGDLLPWIATGFRGGICLGEMCGALSGAVIALGLMAYKGLGPATDRRQKIACQAILPYVHDLAYGFNRVFGSIHCAVLTGVRERTPEENEIYSRTRVGKDVCSPFVDYVVRKMVSWGEIAQAPPRRLPPGTPPLKLG
ncbi:MAG: C-GCAxxG-C-C family protein [Chloroflexota bacterium]